MFEKLFKRPSVIARQLAAPVASERASFLAQRAEQGAARDTLVHLARQLLVVVRELDLTSGDSITLAAIETAAERWARQQRRRRRARTLRWSRVFFVQTATAWAELGEGIPNLTLFARCAFGMLGRIDWHHDSLIYLDPPSHHDTRRDLTLYRHELKHEDHERLLKLLLPLDAMVQVSGRRCPLYDDMLADWRRIDFDVMTRRGLAAESLWMNYPEPSILHTID
ncbi:MAG: hypothetical protein WBG92_02525 [Thiohalocapsa sp.]